MCVLALTERGKYLRSSSSRDLQRRLITQRTESPVIRVQETCRIYMIHWSGKRGQKTMKFEGANVAVLWLLKNQFFSFWSRNVYLNFSLLLWNFILRLRMEEAASRYGG